LDVKLADNDLALLAAKGDGDAFRALLERHYDRVFRIALRFSGRREDAEDVAQDVCMSLPSKLKSFRGDAAFTTWLYRVVVNRVRDVQRKQVTSERIQNDYGEVEALRRGEEAEAAKEMAWLSEAMNHLSDDLRETVKEAVEGNCEGNDMSEDFKNLESAFRKQAKVSPRAGVKADAIKLAMQAFEEEKISNASQGFETEVRPTNQGNEKKPLFDWKNKMNALNSKFGYSLMGGASLAVLALFIVGPNISQLTTLDEQPEFSSMSEDVVGDPVVEIAPAPLPKLETETTLSQVPDAPSGADVERDTGIVANQAIKKPAVAKSRSLKKMLPNASSGLALQSKSFISRPLPVPSDGVLPQTQNRNTNR